MGVNFSHLKNRCFLWIATHHLEKEWGVKVKTSRVQQTEDGLKIQTLHICGQPGTFTLDADLVIDFEYFFWEKKLAVNCHIKKIEGSFSIYQLRSWIKNGLQSIRKKSWMTLQPFIQLDKGLLYVADSSTTDLYQIHLDDMQLQDSLHNIQGTLHFCNDAHDLGRLVLQSNPQEKSQKVAIEGVDLKWISSFFPLQSLNLSRGRAQGLIEINYHSAIEQTFAVQARIEEAKTSQYAFLDDIIITGFWRKTGLLFSGDIELTGDLLINAPYIGVDGQVSGYTTEIRDAQWAIELKKEWEWDLAIHAMCGEKEVFEPINAFCRYSQAKDVCSGYCVVGACRGIEIDFEGKPIDLFKGDLNLCKVTGKSDDSKSLLLLLKACALIDQIPREYRAFDYKKISFDFNVNLFDFQCVLLQDLDISVDGLKLFHSDKNKSFSLSQAHWTSPLLYSQSERWNATSFQLDLKKLSVADKWRDQLFSIQDADISIVALQGEVVQLHIDAQVDQSELVVDFDAEHRDRFFLNYYGRFPPFLSQLDGPMVKPISQILSNQPIRLHLSGSSHELFYYLNGQIEVGASELQDLNFSLEVPKKSLPLDIQSWFAPTSIALSNDVRGWFSAKQMQLHQIFGPFLPQDPHVYLSGVVDLKGELSQNILNLYFKTNRCELLSEVAEVCLEEVGLETSTDLHQGWYASCAYHLKEDSFSGLIPVRLLKISQPSTNVVYQFSDVELYFSNKKLEARNVKGVVDNIEFIADLNLEMSSDRNIKLSFSSKEAEGLLSSFEQFLSKLIQSDRVVMPLEGLFKMGKDDLKWTWDTSRSPELILSFHGCIYNGYTLLDNQISMKNISATVNFSTENDLLYLDNFEGFCQKKGHQYRVVNRNPIQINCNQKTADFSFAIHEKDHQIAYLEGGLSQFQDFDNHSFMQIHLLPASFFMGTEVISGNMIFGIDGALQDAEIVTQTPFDGVMPTLKAIFHLALDSAEQEVFLCEKDWIQGVFTSYIKYNQASKNSQIRITSEQANIADYNLENLELVAQWGNKQVNIDHFSASGWIIKGKVWYEQEDLAIQNLSFYYKDLLKGELMGKFNPFSGDVRFFIRAAELDLSHLDELEPFNTLPILKKVEGSVNLQGSLEKNLKKSNESWSSNLFLSYQNVRIDQVDFKDKEEIQVKLDPNNNLVINNFEMASELNLNETYTWFNVGSLKYKPSVNSFAIKNLNFTLPKENLGSLGHLVELYAPHFSEPFQKIIDKLKVDSVLQGTVHLHLASEGSKISGVIKDGKYDFFDREWELKNIQFNYDQGKTRLKHDILYNDHWYEVDSEWKSEEEMKGHMFISDKKTNSDELDPLFILWRWPHNGEPIVESAKGEVSGVRVNLEKKEKEDNSSGIGLQGSIDIDFSQAIICLPVKYQKWIEDLKIGKGYRLEGVWELNTKNFLEAHFNGNLVAETFDIGGFTFQKLEAKVNSGTDFVKVEQLHMGDAVGSIDIPIIYMYREKAKEWTFDIPSIAGKNIFPKRFGAFIPSTEKTKASSKRLKIDQLRIYDLKGRLKDPNSWKGHGNLAFTHFSRIHNAPPILTLPTQLFSRLGFGDRMLVPSGGSIDFDIKEKRVFLTKFDEIYSYDKLSKFLLYPGYKSYITFDGQLNINVRLKQYNVLMKLVDPMLLHISGTLKNPEFNRMRREGNVAHKKNKIS